MKLKKITIIEIIGCIIGLSLLLYPTISNYWNSKHATQAINNYMDSILELSDEEYEDYMIEANFYNADLLSRDNYYSLDSARRKKYNTLLNVNNDGIMGYIEIEKIGILIPIYHGTSDEVLQSAIGHLEWSSLPVGGESTHSVLSGHRGLANMKLFTDLDKLKIGDIFTLNVLKETLYYEIDSITTVDPDDVENLVIVPEKDYSTLVTCTPYGINTHRLLVRGHRIEGKHLNAKIISEAIIVDRAIVSTFLAIPFLLILLLIVLFKKPQSKKVIKEKK